MHDQSVITVRFDGIYADILGDNLSFTFLSHYIDATGRDHFKNSVIGVIGLLRLGVNLDKVQIVGPNTPVFNPGDRK